MGVLVEPPAEGFEVGQRVYWHQDLADPDDDGFRAAIVRSVNHDRHGRALTCQIVPDGGSAPRSTEVASLHHTPNIKAGCRSCTQRGWLPTA